MLVIYFEKCAPTLKVSFVCLIKAQALRNKDRTVNRTRRERKGRIQIPKDVILQASPEPSPSLQSSKPTQPSPFYWTETQAPNSANTCFPTHVE